MLLGTSGASLLGNLLTVWGTTRAGEDTIRADEGTIRAGQDFNATSSFNKFSNTKVLSKWTYFNGVYSRNDLPKIKDGAYGINLDEFKSVGTHWIALSVNVNNIIYFDSFGVEHIPKGIKKSIGNKNIMISSLDTLYWIYWFYVKKVKACLIIQIYFLLMIMRRMIK